MLRDNFGPIEEMNEKELKTALRFAEEQVEIDEAMIRVDTDAKNHFIEAGDIYKVSWCEDLVREWREELESDTEFLNDCRKRAKEIGII